MKYLSVCSGIEAASTAWDGLGWQAVGFSEIDGFPSAVLRHRYPAVKNLGSMLDFEKWDLDGFDLLVGGTPCQSFSVNGLRKGLTDERGNLALTYCLILARWRPRWFIWENVPGVLSSCGGRDFRCLTGAMAQLGYGFCYRVLDAKYFGVPQNRRRVFIVGYLGDYRPPAEVLLEPESLPRLPQQDGQSAGGQAGSASGNDASTAEVPRLYRRLRHYCFRDDERSSTLAARDFKSPADLVVHGGRIRKLTPREYERLMGFPDDYTLINYKHYTTDNLPDKLRYKALGNSMAVPVMRWIGQRVDLVNYTRTLPG